MNPRLKAALLLLALAAVTVPAVWQVSKLRTVYDVEQFFPADDPEVDYYHRFRAAFGLEDNSVLLLLTGAEVFTPRGVETVRRLTRAVEGLAGVEQVTSLANTAEVRAGEGDEVLVTEPLGQDYLGPASLTAVKRRLLADPMFRDRLVSRDGRTTCILARVSKAAAAPRSAGALEQALLGAVRQHGAGGFTVMLGGAPLVRARYMALINKDMGTLMPLVLLLFAVLLAVIFRGVGGVMLPLMAVALAALWVLGVYSAVGGDLGTLTSMVPVILLVVGLSDAIHVLASYRHNASAGGAGGSPLRQTFRQVGLACLMTTITTAVGFSVLALSDMKAVRSFGALTAGGVVMALVATMVFLPAALAVLPAPRKTGPRKGMLDRALASLTGLCLRRPRWVLAGGAVLVLVCALGAARVSREVRLYGNLPPGHPILRTERFVDRHLGGALSLEVTLDGGRAGGAVTPRALAELERLERWLRRQPEVHATRSVLDPLRAIHRVMTGEDALPREGDLIGQYLLLLSFADNDPTTPYLGHSRRWARLSVQLPDMGQRATLRLISGIRAVASGALSFPSTAPAPRVRVTGTTAILHRMYRSVVDGMVFSFALALGVILIIITALFRSARLALVSLVPNAIPLLAALGFMGWSGIALGPTNSLVFAVAFGIAVDDTIHFLAHYRRRLAAGGTVEEAITEAMRRAGRPIVWTSVVLVTGFSVLLASSFLGNVYFGLITAVTLLAALVADLAVLPALLMLLGGRRSTPASSADPPRTG